MESLKYHQSIESSTQEDESKIMLIVETLILFLFFTFLHEAAHVLSAKLVKTKIVKYGFSIIPYPHFYVTVEDIKNKIAEYIYFLSGIGAVSFLILFFYTIDFIRIKSIYIAIFTRFLLDTNPFFSDLTLLKKEYKYSFFWYFHFIGWGSLIYFVFTIMETQVESKILLQFLHLSLL